MQIDSNLSLIQQSWFESTSLYHEQLQHALISDRFALKKLRDKLIKFRDESKQDLQKIEDAQQQWLERFIRSCEIVQSRQDQVQRKSIDFPKQLPVTQQRDEIKSLIQANQLVIVAGETGSGKTTQLPKMCLELGYGRYGMIGHTQPRRVAATAVASRISEELHSPLGEMVAYQVRFADYSKPETNIKLMTDGILLAEIAHDRFLEKYDCLIIDEAHERSLNIDFLLGYLKRILPKRPDLKVVITSATIDTDKFSKHFSDAPIINVEGRSFPVEMVYQSVSDLSEERSMSDAVEQVLQVIEEDERESGQERGDVLVFLPGEGEIRELSKSLRHADLHQIEVLPLYARLPSKEQQRILTPNRNKALRRLVLATNVAETSLTVPGIRYVIDSGLARVSRYSHRSKVQQLPIEKISQAAANQRAGRCGRVSEGVCFRLYDEDDFNRREAFTQPEIQRTNLSAVILQMQRLRLGDVHKFDFIDKPDKRLVNDGYKQLHELGALNQERRLTGLGKQMSGLPIDPQLARILMQADTEGCLSEAVVIVAALSIQDPRDYPAEKREAAQQKHSEYKEVESDFVALTKLWKLAEEQRQDLSQNQFRKWCQKQFLSYQRLHEWRELHRQLLQIVKGMGLKLNSQQAKQASIHRALLTGFMTQIGFQEEPKLFNGVRNRQFRVFPSSYVAKKPPKWIMAAQLIETSQLFAHKVGKIEPEWVAELGQHLLKYQHAEPHFSSKQGQVLVWQTASLYGLKVEERKRVSYSQVDQVAARELFIREALVAEQLRSALRFYQHNRNLREEAETLEEKGRRRDIVVSDEVIYEFYNQLLPKQIFNAKALEKWVKGLDKKNEQKLFAPRHIFIQEDQLSGLDQDAFPDHIEWQGVRYPLKYSFNPGQENDGVSVIVPIESLNRVPKFLFEWLVPGLLPEKVEALLKCLPKSQRKKLVPLPETVKQILPKLKIADVSLSLAMAEAIKQTHNVTISHDDWQLDKLDNYYQMTIVVTGQSTDSERSNKSAFKHKPQQKKLSEKPSKKMLKNAELDRSKSLRELISKHGDKVQKSLEAEVKQNTEQKLYKRWEFGDLEAKKLIRKGQASIQSYPAIKDKGDAVEVTLCDYPHTQAATHLKGLCRLTQLNLASLFKYIRKEVLKGNQFSLTMPPELQVQALKDDLMLASIRHVFFYEHQPFSQSSFESLLSKHKQDLTGFALDIDKMLKSLFEADHQLRVQISKHSGSNFQASIADIQEQRHRLLYPGFLFATERDYLFELPRYFAAILARVERLSGNLNKDKQCLDELQEYRQRQDQLLEQWPDVINLPEFVQFRWMVEEYRVSLFAQRLKTKYPISAKRLEKQWQLVIDEKNAKII